MIKESRNYINYNPMQQVSYELDLLFKPIIIEINKELTGEKDTMWQAKNRCTGETYGKPFKSIMECDEYIEKELRSLNKVLKLAEEIKNEIFKTGYNGARVIQCYNIDQQRWADGFDY